MVKQAEKLRKRNPLLPVFGMLLAVGLFGVAFVLVDPAMKLIQTLLKKTSAPPLIWPPMYGENENLQRIAIAFAMWLIFLIIAWTFVAIATGKDPNSPKDIEMPPRTKEERNKRY